MSYTFLLGPFYGLSILTFSLVATCLKVALYLPQPHPLETPTLAEIQCSCIPFNHVSTDNYLPHYNMLARSPLPTTPLTQLLGLSPSLFPEAPLRLSSKPASTPLWPEKGYPYQATYSHHTFPRFREGNRNEEMKHPLKKYDQISIPKIIPITPNSNS